MSSRPTRSPWWRSPAVRSRRSPEELGIHDSSLGNWVSQARERAEGEPTPQERAEIRELSESSSGSRESGTSWVKQRPTSGTRPEERVMKIYSFIAEEQANNSIWTISEMCRVLDVSRLGFYDWMAHRGCIAGCASRASSSVTTGSRGSWRPTAGKVRPVVARCAPPSSTAAPDTIWCGDITYLRTGEGWLYLATVIDLYSRRVIGWSVADHMRTELVADALDAGVASTS
jgi:hypothetical protein